VRINDPAIPRDLVEPIRTRGPLSSESVLRSSLISVVLVLAGCSARAVEDTDTEAGGGGTGSDGTSTGSSTVPTGSSTTFPGTTDPGTSTGDPGTAGGTTDACADQAEDEGPVLDVGPPGPECDLFDQDCPDAEKCVPDGWWTRVCVPTSADPIADGEPCTPGDEDPCGPTAWCTEIVSDDPTCLPMCMGSRSEPQCPPEMICVIDDEQVVAYCAPPCDPLDPDACGSGVGCKITPHGFGCVQTGEQMEGETCYEQDSCLGGLACVAAEHVPGCCGELCCTATCSDAEPCAAGDCIPFDPRVPGADDIGHCG
jgi:hypothetical protein